MNPLAWIVGWDTGASSKTIWSVMMGVDSIEHGPSIPYDRDDFGRCYRLLKGIPIWRERLPEVAAKYPIWRSMVENWDKLTELYEGKWELDFDRAISQVVNESRKVK